MQASVMNENEMLIEEILKLKEERGALVLAHYYQRLEIQKCADFVGDSFELAKRAKEAENNLIVFCGVRFMGESAKILNPTKKVLMPRPDAGCQMADMVTASKLRELKGQYPKAAVVCYVNSSAETKAESDICCTSSNAVRVCESLDTNEIIFVPDKNLGAYVAGKLPDKMFHFYYGYCPVHRNITRDEALKAKKQHPNARLLVHPECEKEVVDLADYVGSTSGIIREAESSTAEEFIIGTEYGVVERLTEYNPGKKFYLLSPKLVCINMKYTSLINLRDCLRDEIGEIDMPEELRLKAFTPLDRMMRV